MAFTFTGEYENLLPGINELCPPTLPAITIDVVKNSNNRLSVTGADNNFQISYDKPIQFFRGLSYLLAYEPGQAFTIIDEAPAFKTCGVMIDVSQGNAVPTLDTWFSVLRNMALMGLDMLMIYTEDNFVVDQEPYFGYMRGRYTQEDFKRLDDYAYMLGIEIIPCIQTLAHLIDALKWATYDHIKDDDDTLLVGAPDTYALIDKLIKAACAPFRSRRIHIGMDEAWKLGQGNYLLKNGYRSKFDIMTEHLEQVLQITKKYGLDPIIWSDMYFRAASKTGSYYDPEDNIPQEVYDSLPQGVTLCYWDYYHKDQAFYEDRFRRHRCFGHSPMFAGGIWNWNSYAVEYDMTFATTEPAMAACKASGIEEVMITLWGDGTTECPLNATLLGLQLLAEHQYTPSPDQGHLSSRFAQCTGGCLEDFYAITGLDVLPGVARPQTNTVNPSKFLMWQDVMMGLFDKNVENLPLQAHYSELAEQFHLASQRNGEHNELFAFYEQVAALLAKKGPLGNQLVAAYQQNNKEELARLAGQLPKLAAMGEVLRTNHRQLWHKLYLPFGFEVMDIRYGGLIARFHTAHQRLSDYLCGNINKLEELEEERLLFDGKEGLMLCLPYSRMPSAGRLSFALGF